jgi:glycosyltransferase involved in cell wall biosynthesis
MVARDDHEAMAASAFRLLEDPELAARLTRRAREESRKFTWPAVRDEWLRLYRELAPGAAGERRGAEGAPAPRQREA